MKQYSQIVAELSYTNQIYLLTKIESCLVEDEEKENRKSEKASHI